MGAREIELPYDYVDCSFALQSKQIRVKVNIKHIKFYQDPFNILEIRAETKSQFCRTATTL